VYLFERITVEPLIRRRNRFLFRSHPL